MEQSQLLIPEGFIVQDPYLLSLTNIPTRDQEGISNGYLFSVVNQWTDIPSAIEQVYITVTEPGSIKGPHCHLPGKWDRFLCIHGHANVVCRNEQTQEYFRFQLRAHNPQLLIIPPYVSHGIHNPAFAADSWVLSMPTEGFNPKEEYNQVNTRYYPNWWKTK